MRLLPQILALALAGCGVDQETDVAPLAPPISTRSTVAAAPCVLDQGMTASGVFDCSALQVDVQLALRRLHRLVPDPTVFARLEIKIDPNESIAANSFIDGGAAVPEHWIVITHTARALLHELLHIAYPPVPGHDPHEGWNTNGFDAASADYVQVAVDLVNPAGKIGPQNQ